MQVLRLGKTVGAPLSQLGNLQLRASRTWEVYLLSVVPHPKELALAGFPQPLNTAVKE